MLETEAGKPYQSVFEAVRLQHVINDIASAQILDTDRIIPESNIFILTENANMHV